MLGESVLGQLLPQILFVLGVGFLVANLLVFLEGLRFMKRRSSALLTWLAPRPRYSGLLLAMGVALGCLLFYKLIFLRRPPQRVFGDAMMFLYYGYALPLSWRIRRGFYRDGIWAETGFVPYAEIGAVSWREGDTITLLVVNRLKRLARRLVVPADHYAAARRLLRDKIAAREIQLMSTGLVLGAHDEREDV
jgi:hypothetical protein